MDPVSGHLGNWFGVVLFSLIGVVFLAFTPFYKKSQRKPSGAFLAFVIAFALEMFGVPFSMYVIAWLVGHNLPDGILWGHTLQPYIGIWGMYLNIACDLIALALVVAGWSVIHKRYWSKEGGSGELVTEGIYHYVRHPQYTGFLLVTFGMILEWATIPLLVMWPLLAYMYYRLARKEEADMEAEFGEAYRAYRACTGMFLPRIAVPQPTRTPQAG
jgi:protein-S-isoprenylcysteine O-methyltransferase Ste14